MRGAADGTAASPKHTAISGGAQTQPVALPDDEEALTALGSRDLARLLGTDADGLTADEMRAKIRLRMLGLE